jgi:hypothetical protein
MRVASGGLAVVISCLICLPAVAVQYQWTQVTSSAAFSRRDGAGGVTYDGKMWLLGGWLSGSTTYNDVWNSTDGLNWTRVRLNTPYPTSPPYPTNIWEGRHCGGYAVFNNKMWIAGGDPNQGHYQPGVWSSSDGVTWTQTTANAPWGQRNLSVTMVHDNKLWVMGGQTLPEYVPGYPEEFYNDVWNTSDGVTWTQVTAHAAWSPRGMIQGSVEFNGRMYLLGGGTYNTVAHPTRLFYNEVWSSTDGLDWRKDTTAPWAARQYHSVGVFDNKMWVMAGGNFETAEYNRNDVWYSSDGTNWTQLANTPWPTRHAGTLFVHDNHMWMMAGSHIGSNPINDVWRLDKIGTPEPATAALLVCAGFSLLAYVWCRRRP